MDMTRCDLRAHLGVEALKQLPGIGFEIAEDREVVSLVRIVDELEGLHLVARWHEHRAERESVRGSISILEHNRLKLGLVEVDAETIRGLLVEAGVTMRPLPCNVNRPSALARIDPGLLTKIGPLHIQA